MKYLLTCIIIACSLSACAGRVKEPVIKTVVVEVPVPTRAVPPEALLACGSTIPGFRFYAGPNGKDVLILESDQPAFQAWVNEKQRCIAAWQEWTK